MCTSDLIGVIALIQYREIIIAGGQTQRFYNNLFPNGLIHFALVNWTGQGGILTAHMADNASGPGAGGNWDGLIFLAGVRKVTSFANNNGIADPRHPVVTGEFGGCTGGPLVDVGALADLDGWNFSSHGFFTNLPLGTQVVLAEQADGMIDLTRPVLVDYPFGRGRVIASMTTSEFRYVGGFGNLPQNRKLIANEFGYQHHLAKLQTEPREATEA